MQEPSLGRIVLYRSKTGKYTLPAVIVATQDTLAEEGVQVYSETHGKRGVPPLSSPDHVHLIVLTPGIPLTGPNRRGDEAPASDLKGAANLAGTYQEWNVPLWEPSGPSLQELAQPQAGPRPPEEQPGGTWVWPVIR